MKLKRSKKITKTMIETVIAKMPAVLAPTLVKIDIDDSVVTFRFDAKSEIAKIQAYNVSETVARLGGINRRGQSVPIYGDETKYWICRDELQHQPRRFSPG